jgi:hypothetical protein
MVEYPVRVPTLTYRGKDPRKRAKNNEHNHHAQKLEQAINELVAQQDRRVQAYMWHMFTQVTGLSVDQIRDVGFAIDCGSNGFTVFRPDLPE